MSMPTENGQTPDPPPEERHRTPSRGEQRVEQDDLSELLDPEAADEDEQAEDEELELDQVELDELGLTLDDPHQPTDE
jgi:hypothetical protein